MSGWYAPPPLPSSGGGDPTKLPLRGLAEGFGLSALSGFALWLVGLTAHLAVALAVLAAAVAYGVAMRALEPPPVRWVVGLARTTTFWCVALPLFQLVPELVQPALVVILIFWLLIQVPLGMGGTALVRRRHYAAGVLLKLVSLVPYGFCVLAFFMGPMALGEWAAAMLGLSAVALAAGLIAAAVGARVRAS